MHPVDLLVSLIIAIAFFGESIFGFGGGLISVPLLSLLLGVRDAVTLVLVFQLCMGLLVWKSYKFIDWKAAKPMSFSIIVGTILGTLLLSRVSIVFLQVFLAIAILMFLIKMVWFNAFTTTRKHQAILAHSAGLGGGLFQGLIGTGGPILTMYLSVAVVKKLSLRATLIYLFFVSSLVRLAISIPKHLFTPHLSLMVLVALPFFLVAIVGGQRIHAKASERVYRLGIYIILAGSSVLLIVKALSA